MSPLGYEVKATDWLHLQMKTIFIFYTTHQAYGTKSNTCSEIYYEYINMNIQLTFVVELELWSQFTKASLRGSKTAYL